MAKVNEKYNFCTITGKDYMVKVIALHRSLQKHTDRFIHWICCIDAAAYATLEKMKLANAVLVKVEELEDDRLRKLKSERKTSEYCWTIKSVLVEYVLEKGKVDSIVYLDGDVFFFSDPKAIFDEWGDYSAYICPQRDMDWVEAIYGKYQAGIIGFKNDSYGLQSLKWWKNSCMDWCSAVPGPGTFGDQKYLETIVTAFPNIKVSNHLGVDAAPWNSVYNPYNNFSIYPKEGYVYINDCKLVAFHFACLAMYNENEFELWSLDTLSINWMIMNEIYMPYLVKLREAMEEIGAADDQMPSLCFSPNKHLAKTYFYFSGS
jgi:hypothetical protein